MGMSLSEVDALLLALERAKATGQLDIEYDGKSVKYRSLAEIDSTLLWLERKRADLTGTSRSKQIRMNTRMGQ